MSASKAGRRVLVTRPQPAAARTAVQLVDMGHKPVLLPLTRTVALEFSLPEGRFDALTVTSANAFRHIDAHRLQSLTALPLFAVGEGTAQAAREAGYSDVIEGGGDAVRLARTMGEALPENARVLYLAGRVRQPVFEERIAASRIAMSVCNVYDIEPVHYEADTLDHILGDAPFDAVLFYSAVAARRFAEITRGIEARIGADARFLCISARVAHTLPPHWRSRALVADHPDEPELFRLFAEL